MFRSTFKFDNFYFNYHIEANQVNFSPFSRFEIRTPDVRRSVPPNVPLGTVVKRLCIRLVRFQFPDLSIFKGLLNYLHNYI